MARPDELPPSSTGDGAMTAAATGDVADGATIAGSDRRRTPRRRLRDRIASLDSTDNPALRSQHELQNLVLLVDDDLRQTALALGAIEAYLGRSAAALEKTDIGHDELAALADDEELLERMDELSENMSNLRRRMGSIAASLK